MGRTFDSEKELSDYINRESILFSIEPNEKFNFEECRFTFEVKFDSFLNEFESIVTFKNALFEKPVSFNNITFKNIADFVGCSFFHKATFDNAHFLNKVKFGEFHKSVSFKTSHFHNETTFQINFPQSVDFSYCHFYYKLDLSSRVFNQEVYLNNSFFYKEVTFKSTEFKKKVNAWETTFKSDLIFNWTDFRDKLNLTESHISKGKTDFYGTNFEGNAYFYKTEFKKLDLKNCVIEKGIYFLDAKIKRGNRETNRIIKNQFTKQNNRIEALKFHHKEMSAYLLELIIEAFKNLSNLKLWKLLKNIGDIVILFINFLSNGFGLWWFSGVVFLFVTTTFMFKYYLNNINSNIIIDFSNYEYWKYYVQFIIPTHKFDFITNAALTDKSYIIDYLNRLISAFGIYQTVQAFRKFGKI